MTKTLVHTTRYITSSSQSSYKGSTNNWILDIGQNMTFSFLSLTRWIVCSGYYWCHPTPINDDHCDAWLDPNLDGLYAGKYDHIAKLSFTLTDDNLPAFMKLYTALCAGLNTCSFNPHLLSILPCIRPEVDLVTLIVVESALIVGTGKDPSNLCTPRINCWQQAHDSLGMTLYALLLESIKLSAHNAYQALHNGLNWVNPMVLPWYMKIFACIVRVSQNSLAPAYSVIYSQPPTMQIPGHKGTYKLSHSTYITNYCNWEKQLRYYSEFTHCVPTHLIVQFIHGLLRELWPRILHIENILLWHQATHHFKSVEPSLPPCLTKSTPQTGLHNPTRCQ